ncbi:MAG TPA: Coenzyme F420 hydrogenase/dehydrogenase, beta subunit C-terminal domain [Chthoniobacterales bacterium]|nr:Coenzyme F420 hydrogenase/dehydrogenase, beta subunit C-terminal domain [Chthoniobacterales bacterium]
MPPAPANQLSLNDIVENGLCIGCGLCKSVAQPEQVELVTTPEGRERPVAQHPLSQEAITRINAICPGTQIAGPALNGQPQGVELDTVWGAAERISIGHATDPEVRFRASTGGVLTALGQFLVDSRRVNFVLHVGASPSAPMRSSRKLSFDAISVLDAAGSRYGPAPLADFCEVLDRKEPFALIAKPCDITAVRNLAKIDPRVDQYMRYALTFLCGGASDFTKSEDVLAGFGLREEELRLFRYRGYGNPGLTRVETTDGRAFGLTYQQLWEDESKWMIQPRCKICADAIGLAADVVASDVWPGGGPTGEDEGYNGIIVRTPRGLELYEAAIAAGKLTVLQPATFRDFDVFQPHQVRKRRAIWARFCGLQSAGKPIPETTNLNIKDCARQNSLADNLREARGARDRAKRGRLGEPQPIARSEYRSSD